MSFSMRERDSQPYVHSASLTYEEEEEEEIKPYVHSAILTYEDKSMFTFSPNGPA